MQEETTASSGAATPTDSGGENSQDDLGPNAHISLLDQHSRLKQVAEQCKETAREKQLKEEQKILESVAEKTGRNDEHDSSSFPISIILFYIILF